MKRFLILAVASAGILAGADPRAVGWARKGDRDPE